MEPVDQEYKMPPYFLWTCQKSHLLPWMVNVRSLHWWFDNYPSSWRKKKRFALALQLCISQWKWRNYWRGSVIALQLYITCLHDCICNFIFYGEVWWMLEPSRQWRNYNCPRRDILDSLKKKQRHPRLSKVPWVSEASTRDRDPNTTHTLLEQPGLYDWRTNIHYIGVWGKLHTAGLHKSPLHHCQRNQLFRKKNS